MKLTYIDCNLTNLSLLAVQAESDMKAIRSMPCSFNPAGLYRQVQCCGDLLDQKPDDHHAVNGPFLAGVVSKDRHEGKQQAHQAIL